MQIPLINEHLFCKYFVRLSVSNATANALLLMDVFILVIQINILYFQIPVGGEGGNVQRPPRVILKHSTHLKITLPLLKIFYN